MTLRVGLLNHAFGWPNLGVDALSRTNIAIMRKAGERAGVDVEFVILGKPGNSSPSDADVRQGPYFRIRNLIDGKFGSFADAVKSCDLIVDICAGDGFTSIYGNFLFALYAVPKITALRAGRPLVFAPQTIGPFDSAWTRAVASRIIDKARLTFARDGKSAQVFRDMGLTSPFEEVVDVAFRLPFTRPERHPGGPARVGINVSGLLYYHGHRFQLTADYPTVVRRLISSFLDKGAEVWLVSHVLDDSASTENDDAAVNEMAQAFPVAEVAPRFADASAAKSFISGLDFFTGGRMHACIGAFSSGVPVVPFAYSRKFNGLFDTLGYHRYVDGRVVNADTVVSQTLVAFDERARLAEEIAPGMAEANRRLAIYEDRLVELMQEAAGKRGVGGKVGSRPTARALKEPTTFASQGQAERP